MGISGSQILYPEAGSAASYDASHQPHVESGANIGFKVGLQQTIDNMISHPATYPAVHGSFYLTQDTHRLYVGNSDHTLSAVNEGITTVGQIGDLPDLATNPTPYIGRFYYIKGTGVNILCVASYDNNGNAQWVQLNPDTYLDSLNSSITIANDTGASNGATGAIVTNSIRDTGGREVRQGWTLRGTSNITVGYNNENKIITLSVPDSGIYNQFYESVVSGDVVVGVKVSLRQYTSTAARDADTAGTGGTLVKEFILYKGSGGVTPTLQADGKTIKLEGGGLTGSSTIELSGGSSNTPITFTIKDGNNNSIAADITPTITVGNNPTTAVPVVLAQTATKGVNGATKNAYTLNATLPVYTKTEVDSLLNEQKNTADAMYFAGTIGTGGTIGSLEALIKANATTTTNLAVRNGATFKITEIQNNNIAGVTATAEGFTPTGMTTDPMEVGDLIIVSGVEGTNGYIENLNAATTKYIYVPSGNDDDIYFQPDFATTNAAKWVQHTTGPNAKTYQLDFEAGQKLTLADTGASTSGNTIGKKLTIGHATIDAPTVANSGITVGTEVTMQPGQANTVTNYTAITDLTFDGYGHVIGYQTKKINLWSNSLTNVESKATADTSVTGESAVLISKTYTQSGGVLAPGFYNNNVRYSSNTLTVTAKAAGSATGTAGAAANIHIDMLWGSF